MAVYLDGARGFDLAAIVVEGEGLQVGRRLTVTDQERLHDLDAPYRARDRALRLLAVRDRSAQEVRLRLQQSGFAAAVVDDVIRWLRGLGYLDDSRFASGYAAEKARGGWGGRRISAELARKGVERRVVDEILTRRVEDEAPAAEGLEAVTALARRRFGRQFAEDPQGAARRVAGFLARRGYDWDSIHAVVRELQGENAEPEDP